ncbi:hypothetical protein JOB18_028475 [Solea senegalensis]|uniref:Uncharacterized protein n=1 Tax=Solea senegalensis TaxID=28829 RepID=A0AAV6S4R8_SOLSE|nr:hypothetical protein JOB18_028475 [Solea senegalensis]
MVHDTEGLTVEHRSTHPRSDEHWSVESLFTSLPWIPSPAQRRLNITTEKKNVFLHLLVRRVQFCCFDTLTVRGQLRRCDIIFSLHGSSGGSNSRGKIGAVLLPDADTPHDTSPGLST